MIRVTDRAVIITAQREISYAELLRRIGGYAALCPLAAGERAVIFAENREGYIYALYAAWANGGIPVPVDAGSTPPDLAYVLDDCRPTALWVTRQTLAVARQAIELAECKPRLLMLDDHEDDELPHEPATLTPRGEDTALIIYTSGTTGAPKGVMLSHDNLRANIRSVSEDVPIFTTSRRTLVLLPLHHVLPLVGSVVAPLMVGGGVAISPGMDGPQIMDTMRRAGIAIVIGVPRLYQSIYAGVMRKVNASPLARALYNICMRARSRRLSRLVFGSVRRGMGGRLDYCVCGGAALDINVAKGLRALGLDVLEGYGMTEFAPIIAFTRPGDIVPGCSGLPLPGVEIRLTPQGELCAKGPNLMQGYWGKPQETAAALDEDGYLHTGDLARIDPQGRVHITGRAKELIVLSNGKNVQPAEIEAKLEAYADVVSEAAVTEMGDQLCAIVVPRPAVAEGLTLAQLTALVRRDVLTEYNKRVESYKRVAGLAISLDPLPRTRLEKLRRHLLPGLAQAAGRPQAERVAQPEPDTPEYRMLRDYIAREKGVTPRPTDHLETDLGMDSLDRVGLQAYIEGAFGATVPAHHMADMPTLAHLAQRVAACRTTLRDEPVDWREALCNPPQGLSLPRSTPLFPLGIGLIGTILRLWNRLTVRGLHNLPPDGPYILAPNHQSYVDGGAVLASLPRGRARRCYSYATEEHVQGALLRAMARNSNVVLMERARLRDSIARLGLALRRGGSVVIFPEGSRTHTGEVGEFKKTFAVLAAHTGAPIVPVRIEGAYRALPRGSRFIRPRRITVTFLPPVWPDPAEPPQQLANRVKDTICNPCDT